MPLNLRGVGVYVFQHKVSVTGETSLHNSSSAYVLQALQSVDYFRMLPFWTGDLRGQRREWANE